MVKGKNEFSLDELDVFKDTVEIVDGLEFSDIVSTKSEDSSVDDTIDIAEPHIVLDNAVFSRVVKVLGSIIANNARDIVLSSIYFEVMDGKVVLRATNLDVYAEVELPLLNIGNVTIDKCMVHYKSLAQVVGYVDRKFILVQQSDGSLQVRVFGDYTEIKGMVGEDVDKLSAKYVSPIEDVEVSKGGVEWKEFDDAISFVLPLALSAMSPSDRKVFFRDKGIGVKHMWSYTEHKFSQAVGYSVAARDIAVVYGIGKLVGSTKVVFCEKGESNAVISGDGFKIVLNRGKVEDNKLRLIDIGAEVEGSGVDINEQIQKVVKFSTDFESARGLVCFSKASNGIQIGVLFDNKQYRYYYLGEGDGITENMDFQSKLFGVIISKYSNGDIINFGDKGLVVKGKDVFTKLIGKAR